MRYLFICLLALGFIACSKEKSDDVFIRIVNHTSQTMEEVRVGSGIISSIPSGSASEFIKMESPVYSPGCMFQWSGANAFAGYGICGTPMPPPIEGGYYTYTISEAAPAFRLEVTRQ